MGDPRSLEPIFNKECFVPQHPNPLFLGEWTSGLNRIFGENIPDNRAWTEKSDMLNVLNAISGEACIILYPTFGWSQLMGAAEALHEPGCFALATGGSEAIINPLLLKFFKADDSLSLAHFRLNLGSLPLYFSEQLADYGRESAVDVDGKFQPGEVWDADPALYPLPASARLVTRHWGNSLLFVMKTSLIARLDATIDKWQRIPEEEFNSHLAIISK